MRAPSARRVSSVGSLTPERAVAVQFSAFHLEREREGRKEFRTYVRAREGGRAEVRRASHVCGEDKRV